jgi:hypothetical protein
LKGRGKMESEIIKEIEALKNDREIQLKNDMKKKESILRDLKKSREKDLYFALRTILINR